MYKKNENLAKYLKLFSTTFFMQGMIQLAGLIAGFIIVRQLSVQEYAYYTLANSLLMMLLVLSNCGITSATYALGGEVWQDKKKLSNVLSTALYLRKKFSLIALLIGLPIAVIMLRKQDCGWMSILLIITAFIPTFKAQLTDSIYEVVPNLHQDLKELQFNQLIVSVIRLFLNGFILIFLPLSWIALIANGISRLIGNFYLIRISNKNIEQFDINNHEYKERFIPIIRKTLPGSIYYAFSGMISIFILTNFGGLKDIASWGALNRYSMIFILLSTVIGLLLIPRYVRKFNKRNNIFILGHKILVIGFCLGLIVLFIFYIFRVFLLGLLGMNYISLEFEFLLAMLSGFISLMSSIVIALNIKKGWIPSPIITIGINLVSILVVSNIIIFKSLEDVLIFEIITQSVVFITYYISFIYYTCKRCV